MSQKKFAILGFGTVGSGVAEVWSELENAPLAQGPILVRRDYPEGPFSQYLTQDFAAIEKDGLAAIEARILDTYKNEKALDVITTDLKDDTLTVTVTYCPAVKHLHNTGREVTKWYSYTTSVVMSVLAEAAGYTFTMDSYDEATGAAKYSFHK